MGGGDGGGATPCVMELALRWWSPVYGGGGMGGGYPLCHGAGTEVVESCVWGGGWGGATPCVMELALRWWSPVYGGGDGVKLPLVSWSWH